MPEMPAAPAPDAGQVQGDGERRNVYVVLNPMAGSSDAETIRQSLRQQFGSEERMVEVYKTTGHENVADVVRAALERGFNLLVAAGGDGTISGVASALAGTGVPLGILPVGTGNTLARELGVPLDVEGALALLAGEHRTIDLDAIQIDDRFFTLSVSAGVTALAMRDTERDSKRRFGRIAYIWTGIRKLLGFQPRLFKLQIDGRELRQRASEVMAANIGAAGDPAFRWGPEVRPDDGRLNVCIVRARTLIDYLRVVGRLLLGQPTRDLHVRCLPMERSMTLDAEPALPVQADGELLGETPVRLRVAPRAVRIVVPAAGESAQRRPELEQEETKNGRV